MPLGRLLIIARDKLDLAQVGADLRSAMGTDEKGAERMARLNQDMLRYTQRDGQDLSSELHFSRAFRGNYMELLQATWRVERFNGFLPLPGTTPKS